MILSNQASDIYNWWEALSIPHDACEQYSSYGMNLHFMDAPIPPDGEINFSYADYLWMKDTFLSEQASMQFCDSQALSSDTDNASISAAAMPIAAAVSIASPTLTNLSSGENTTCQSDIDDKEPGRKPKRTYVLSS